MMDMFDLMGSMGWWMLLWAALGLALLTLVVVVVVRLVRSGSSGDRQQPAGRAEEQLRQRYAAGEIGHDEYVSALNILRNQ